MKVMYNGKVIGEVTANHSMTIEDALYAMGYDVNSSEDLERAYNDGCEWVYRDDEGNLAYDFENLEMVY